MDFGPDKSHSIYVYFHSSSNIGVQPNPRSFAECDSSASSSAHDCFGVTAPRGSQSSGTHAWLFRDVIQLLFKKIGQYASSLSQIDPGGNTASPQALLLDHRLRLLAQSTPIQDLARRKNDQVNAIGSTPVTVCQCPRVLLFTMLKRCIDDVVNTQVNDHRFKWDAKKWGHQTLTEELRATSLEPSRNETRNL